MKDLGPVSKEFLETLGVTTNATFVADVTAGQAEEAAELATSLNPTALGSAPNPTYNPMGL